MKHEFVPTGTCSRLIEFETDENGAIHNVRFTGGCNGNLKGIAALVEGLQPEEVIARLSGIRCREKMTSCPDQFAQALAEIKNKA